MDHHLLLSADPIGVTTLDHVPPSHSIPSIVFCHTTKPLSNYQNNSQQLILVFVVGFFFRKINNRLLFSRLGLRKWTVIMSHMPAASWSMSAPYQRVILSHGSVIQPCLQLPTWPKYTNTPTCTCVRTAASSSSLTSCCRHLTLIKVTGSGTRQVQSDFPLAAMSAESKVRSCGL